MPQRSGRKTPKGIHLGPSESLIQTLHPHPLSFMRYYAIGIVLIVWTTVLAVLFLWKPLEGYQDWDWPQKIHLMVPAILWFVLALLLGLTVVRKLHTALQVLYWLAIIALLVVASLAIWLWSLEGKWTLYITLGWAYLDGVLTILAANIYRRAFSYYITNMRIVLKYRLFSTEETNLRFEKIEDFKITRTFLSRLLGIGTIRAYTGTEDGKADPDRSYDSPNEALFGIRKPERVKRVLVGLLLERDRLPHERYAAPAVEPAPPEVAEEPEVQEVPEEVPVPEEVVAVPQEEEPLVYYKPPEPSPPPRPSAERNYERIEVPEDEGPIPPPGPPDEGPAPVPSAPPPRRMYPEAETPQTEFSFERGQDMGFRQPTGQAEKKRRPKRTTEPDEDETYDEGRPRSL